MSIDYADGQGWHDARVIPYGPIELDPSAIVLHYAQGVFEGLKAYRWADGSIVSFRAQANAARMRSSARRLAIPELPEELFVESLRQLIAVDHAWVPSAGGEESLYLRPFIFATEPGLGVRPAKQYRYLVIASPAGAYFKHGIRPVTVWVSTEYVRAARAAPVRPSSVATMRPRWWLRRKPPKKVATKWCGSTPSNAATSKRWAG
ncbi:branched-chain-amino-acid aminotransferase [Mycobacterium xenopi 4042]|uniref:Branched-chain-amino-acid aminotransferase n=1 Tax=Mycobacterium xenopi 4042 TaxID=1299334 RepID=X8DB12_MYCXE|nr:branched-chain-amino-acid aminotransferase [Mycobacterium xenopi 4042]